VADAQDEPVPELGLEVARDVVDGAFAHEAEDAPLDVVVVVVEHAPRQAAEREGRRSWCGAGRQAVRLGRGAQRGRGDRVALASPPRGSAALAEGPGLVAFYTADSGFRQWVSVGGRVEREDASVGTDLHTRQPVRDLGWLRLGLARCDLAGTGSSGGGSGRQQGDAATSHMSWLQLKRELGVLPSLAKDAITNLVDGGGRAARSAVGRRNTHGTRNGKVVARWARVSCNRVCEEKERIKLETPRGRNQARRQSFNSLKTGDVRPGRNALNMPND